VNKVVTTLSVNAANTKVIATATAGTTGIVVGNVTGTAIETAVDTITLNISGILSADNALTIKATAAINTLAVTTAAGATASATTNLTTLLVNPLDASIAWKGLSDDDTAGANTYTTLAANAVVTLKVADTKTVTLTKL